MKIITHLAQIPTGVDIYLYGAGQAGRNFYKILRRFASHLPIKGFIDSHKSGIIDGIPIINKEEFFSGSYHETLILITSGAWREIERVLKDKNLQNYLVIPPRFLYTSGYDRLSRSDTDPLQTSLTSFLFSSEDREIYQSEIMQTLKLLKTSPDDNLFRILTGHHPDFVNTADAVAHFYYYYATGRQYFDFIRYSHIRTIVEGGVANGAETLQFWQKINQNGHIYGFEPDYNAFLESPHKQQIDNTPGIVISPNGLWSTQGRLGFHQDGLSSHIVNISEDSPIPDGMEVIDVISIDGWKKKENIGKIDFIKMDIEGAEMDALKGARETIKKDRPQLAICIYHQKEHFFQVPLFLDELLEDYVYRLGHYSAGNLETVFYAIPRELI